MWTLVAVYRAFGFLVGFGLFGWAAVSSIRRHGLRNAVTGATHELVEELPLYWRTPVAAWLGIVALPVGVRSRRTRRHRGHHPVAALAREPRASTVALPSKGTAIAGQGA